MVRSILVIGAGFVIILALIAALFFGIVCLAGLQSDAAHKYGPLGKVVGGVMLVGLVPLFKLGMYVARRRRSPDAGNGERDPGRPLP